MLIRTLGQGHNLQFQGQGVQGHKFCPQGQGQRQANVQGLVVKCDY